MAQAYQQASCGGRAPVRQLVLRAAAHFHSSYGAFVIRMPPSWMQQAAQAGVRQVCFPTESLASPMLSAVGIKL